MDVLASSGGKILAGGTDFFPARVDRPILEPIVDISAITELKGISVVPDHVRIGGLTTWSELIRTPLPRCFDSLKAAAREIGSVQIQNRATLAGNLCNASPAADGVPPLLTLDAAVELTSPLGKRQLPLSEFIVGNRKTRLRSSEILSCIQVPRTADNAISSFLKLGARRYLVISIVMVAALIDKDSAGLVSKACIAVGSCSAVARRLPRLEEKLVGQPARPGLGSSLTPELLDSLAPISDVRATAEYRRDAAFSLVRRALDACVGSES
jgi:CO/xanthine dehydrogenase FAD-binding subunit